MKRKQKFVFFLKILNTTKSVQQLRSRDRLNVLRIRGLSGIAALSSTAIFFYLLSSTAILKTLLLYLHYIAPFFEASHSRNIRFDHPSDLCVFVLQRKIKK